MATPVDNDYSINSEDAVFAVLDILPECINEFRTRQTTGEEDLEKRNRIMTCIWRLVASRLLESKANGISWAVFGFRLYRDLCEETNQDVVLQEPRHLPPLIDWEAARQHLNKGQTKEEALQSFFSETRRQITANQEQSQTIADLFDQSLAATGQEREAPTQDDEENDKPSTTKPEEEIKDNAALAKMARSYVAEHGTDSLMDLIQMTECKLCCPSSTPNMSATINSAFETLKPYVEEEFVDWEEAERIATKLVFGVQERGVSSEHISHFVVDTESLLHKAFFQKMMRPGIEMNPARQWRLRVEKELAEGLEQPVQEAVEV